MLIIKNSFYSTFAVTINIDALNLIYTTVTILQSSCLKYSHYKLALQPYHPVHI